MKKNLLLSMLLCAALTASAQDAATVRAQKVNAAQANGLRPTAVSHRPTPLSEASLPRTVRARQKTAANGLTANFSIQDGTSQVVVWNENFDTPTLNNKGQMADWVIDQGEGNAITFTLTQTTGAKAFSAIDSEDQQSLHIDGPYQVYKRTIGTITTANAIDVPANGQLHAWVYGSYMWNEYVVLSLSLSTDDFASETQLWDSTPWTREEGSTWHEVTADLSAFAGQQVKLRFTYGPGTSDVFKSGGYMGDFYVDGLSITGVESIDQISILQGEQVSFVDLSAGHPTSWSWTFSGGTPATSTEQNPTVTYNQAGTFDVSLTVTDSEGQDQVTKTAFVTVEPVAPVAGWELPATFRYQKNASTRFPFVPVFAEVTYKDRSEGFPESHMWSIYHASTVPSDGSPMIPSITSTEPEVKFRHDKTGQWYATYIVQNSVGYDFKDTELWAGFGGLLGNIMPGDSYLTNFTDGDLTLPGANKMGITAWAEKFSKPAVPMLLTGAYVHFTKAQAEELYDQMQSVTFKLCKSENGLPGEEVDIIDSWTLSELNYAQGNAAGMVELEFSQPYVIDYEFFIVIDGIPEKNETMECAIAMAPLRSEGNTAYMLNKGQWRPFTGYFAPAPGGQTSLGVFLIGTYSVVEAAQADDQGVITLAAEDIEVEGNAGRSSVSIFHDMELTGMESDSDWCRVSSEKLLDSEGDQLTITEFPIDYDALPAGLSQRVARLSFSDGITTRTVTVTQKQNLVNSIGRPVAETTATVYDMGGRRVTPAASQPGLYIVRQGGKAAKMVRK